MIETYPNTAALVHAAAGRIVSVLEQALQTKETATLVLTGGKTPEPAYRFLGTPPLSSRIDWNRVQFFWGDERCVPPEDPKSNFGMAWNAFISKLGVPSNHIHRMIGELENVDEAASLYESAIREVMPGPEVPSFDLVLLGMGEDGHVASLFPGTQWDEERLVVANHVPATGARRISMTPRILNQAQAILFLVAGASKSRALAEVLGNPASQLPAARIRPAHGSLTWMLDDPAAGLIRDSKSEIRD